MYWYWYAKGKSLDSISDKDNLFEIKHSFSLKIYYEKDLEKLGFINNISFISNFFLVKFSFKRPHV